MKTDGYALLDSGNGAKLERFGPYIISRPAAQAFWLPTLPDREWQSAHADFSRDDGRGWEGKLPDTWEIEVAGLSFKMANTDFGHLGIFPEQRPFWQWLQKSVAAASLGRKPRILNLFAYSGGSTLAAAKGGAEVCHLDASKGMVAWAGDNARLNNLDGIRWIIDDVRKFLKREVMRGRTYDGIILDPPTFGRGAKGEVFKIEIDLLPILEQCRTLMSDTPLFILLSCHTPGYSPTCLSHLLTQTCSGLGGAVDGGEMFLTGGDGVLPLPSGVYARWEAAR